MSGDHNMHCSGNQPDSEVLKLAKACFCNSEHVDDQDIKAFYRAAFNAGLEAAASRCADVATPDAYYIAEQIRALEMKP